MTSGALYPAVPTDPEWKVVDVRNKESPTSVKMATTSSLGSALAIKILEERGISAEVINLRTIRPLDRESIIASVKKTGRLVSVEDGWPQSGVGSEIIASIIESEAFDYLDAPPVRVTGADIPLPYASGLETFCLPTAQNISDIAEYVCSRPGKKP